MATITIDGQELQVAETDCLNVIEAAGRAGVEIPYYCWHPGLSVVASCRMCLVEVGRKNDEGEIEMGPRLVPACQTPASEGTVVVTDSEKVLENRRAVQEYLLLDHPVDCPICDRAGECDLQDYYYNHGRSQRRDLPEPFSSRRKELGPEVTFFADRCVMCSRCVRFTREVSGTSELQVVDRGNASEIDIFPGFPIDNKLSGNVVDLCPVGALCSRDFLYRQRVWFLNEHDSICTGCATGCSVRVDENRNTIYRLKPRHNPEVNNWWMCDEGRLGYHFVGSDERLSRPRQRRADGWCDVEWPEVIESLQDELVAAAGEGDGRELAFVLSPMLACEEAYLAGEYALSLNPNVQLVLGHVPVVGEDDVYPKSPGPTPVGGDFTIRAEKCPNRRGVAALIEGWGQPPVGFDELLQRVVAGEVTGVVLTGGYHQPWLTTEQVAVLSGLKLLVRTDILSQEASRECGDYLLPGAAWAEKSGSYVNHDGVIQGTQRAVRPPGDARSEGRIFWELAGRARLYHVGDVLDELAGKMTFFAPCADGAVGELGIALGRQEESLT